MPSQPDVAVLYIHGLSPPSHVPGRNATVSSKLNKAVKKYAPNRTAAYASVDLAGLLTARQRALRDVMGPSGGGIWGRVGGWVKEVVTETLLNQAMSFHANGTHRHMVFYAICDALRTLASQCHLDEPYQAGTLDPPPLIVMAYSMGSSTATEFLAEFFHCWSTRGANKDQESHFKVYEERMGSSAVRLLSNIHVFYTIGSPIHWHFPHRPVKRRLPETLKWINIYYSADIIAHPLHDRGYGNHIIDVVLPVFPHTTSPLCIVRKSWWTECTWTAVKLTPVSHLCYIDNDDMYRHVAKTIREVVDGPRRVEHSALGSQDVGSGCTVSSTEGRTNIWGYVPSPIYNQNTDHRPNMTISFENLDEFRASVDQPDTDHVVFLYFHGPVTGSLHTYETKTALDQARSQVDSINRTSHRRLSALYITTDFTSSCLARQPNSQTTNPSSSSTTSPFFKLTSAIETLKSLSDRCTNLLSGDALRQQLIDIASVVMACVTEDVITVSILEGFDQAFSDIGSKLSEIGFGPESGKVAKLVVVGNSLGGALATMYFADLHHRPLSQTTPTSLSKSINTSHHVLPPNVESLNCMELHSFVTLGCHLLWCLDLATVRWPKFVDIEHGELGKCAGLAAKDCVIGVERTDSGVGNEIFAVQDEETVSVGDSGCDLAFDDPVKPSKKPKWLNIIYTSDAFSHPLHPIFSDTAVEEVQLPGATVPPLGETLWNRVKERNVRGVCGAVVGNLSARVGSMFAAISLAYVKDEGVWERVGGRFRDIVEGE